jgi:hypothetical protein
MLQKAGLVIYTNPVQLLVLCAEVEASTQSSTIIVIILILKN